MTRQNIKMTWMLLGLACLALRLHAEPVYNGNDLALKYTAAKPAERPALQKEHLGAFHTFRYLQVASISRDKPEAGALTLETTEPGSGMKITLVVRHKLSLQLVDTLKTNECVAVKGRLTKLGLSDAEPTVVDPAVLKSKDRPAPKPNNELLNEIDTTAH